VYAHCPPHLHTAATVPWEKLICDYGTILADLIHQKNPIKWPQNLRTKSDQFKIFTVAYSRDVLLNADARDAVVHLSIAVTLMFSSSTRVHQTVQLLQHEYPKFTGPVLWPSISYNLSHVEWRIYGMSGRIECIKCQFKTWLTWDSARLTLGMVRDKALGTMPLTKLHKDLQACVWTLAVIFGLKYNNHVKNFIFCNLCNSDVLLLFIKSLWRNFQIFPRYCSNTENGMDWTYQ